MIMSVVIGLIAELILQGIPVLIVRVGLEIIIVMTTGVTGTGHRQYSLAALTVGRQLSAVALGLRPLCKFICLQDSDREVDPFTAGG